MGNQAINEWIQKKADAEGKSRTAVVEELSGATGVSPATIRGLCRGYRMRQYDKIKAIAAATGIPESELAWIPQSS